MHFPIKGREPTEGFSGHTNLMAFAHLIRRPRRKTPSPRTPQAAEASKKSGVKLWELLLKTHESSIGFFQNIHDEP